MRSVNAPPSDYSRFPALVPKDPWFEALSRIPRPSVFIGTQLIDQREGQKSLFYRELLKPNKLDFVLGCGVISGSTATFMTAHRALGKPDYSSSTAARVGQLLPHVLRVARLMIDRSHSAELQDTGTFPMMRIGKHGVEFTNTRARDWINQSSEATLLGHRLRLKNHAMDLLLNHYVSTVLVDDATRMPIAPLEVTAGHDLGTFRLLALPTLTTGPLLTSEPAVLLVVLDGYWRLSKWHADLLGISEAEAQLANALVAGHSPMAHARARNRSIHTIRSQLKALLLKVGVHTQAQLVRKLLLLGAGDS